MTCLNSNRLDGWDLTALCTQTKTISHHGDYILQTVSYINVTAMNKNYE